MENEAKNERNIVVLFPGLGYTCDRSLLYYTGKLLQGLNYEVVRLSYGGFPVIEKGDEADILRCVAIALEQTEDRLKNVDFSEYDDVVFAGKSIGTVVAMRFAQKHEVVARFVLLTPLEQTFESVDSNQTDMLKDNQAIAFHGTADPWANTDTIISACKSRNLPLYLTENTNHSLETGDVGKDIDNLHQVMGQIWKFVTD